MNPNTGIDENGKVICKRVNCLNNQLERCSLDSPRIDKREAYASCLDQTNS